jgi:PAS domain S-box-containing protein
LKIVYIHRLIILVVSVAVIALGAAVIIYAWLLEAKIADPAITGQLPLAKDAAVCFILAGLSMILQLNRKNTKAIGRALAITVMCISVLALFQNLFPAHYQSIFHIFDAYVIFGMASQTSICFILLGLALFLVREESRRYFTQLCLHVVAYIAFIVLVGHILAIPDFFLLSFFSAMAIYSAIAFLLFSVAVSLIHPTIGLTGMIMGNKMGNVMARRLTLRLSVAMLLATYMLIQFYRQRWIGIEFAIAMFAVAFQIVSLFFIYKTTSVLNKIEEKKDIATENFKAIIESAPNALVMANIKGDISLVNKQANKIFGYNASELLGKSLETIIPKRFRMAHKHKHADYYRQPEARNFDQIHDLYALRKDGTEFPVEIGITPIVTDEGTVAIASIVDVTERVQNEAIIKKQLFELQLKNQEMEQFTYIASHDLQEPLRTVLNYIQFLEEDYPEQISGEVALHVSEMKYAVNRMGILVRSLLDYGRLGQNKVLKLTDTGIIVNDVIADLNTLIKTTHASIIIDCKLPVLNTYETELRQLFQNLINNAVKFRKPDVAPIISIGCEKSGEDYEFFIADNGIGIDPKYFQRIFLMFQRLNKINEFEGYGVGLANCKKIVDLHGGRIWVESATGEGSVFKFTIPIIEDEEDS